jgi:hypothetical protein
MVSPLIATLVLFFAGICSSAAQLTASEHRQFEKYREATIKSIEVMREPNGLVNDESFVSGCHSQVTANQTTPTNIGLDVINQLDLLSDPKHRKQALNNLNHMMKTLSGMQTHSSGLFFSMYSTKDRVKPTNKDVSSVDNIHLALALWSASKIGEAKSPKPEFTEMAEKILGKMNFAVFTTPNGMMGGNLNAKKHWRLDDFRYDYLGSEARSISALVNALGLAKPAADGQTPWPVKVPKYHELYSPSDHPILKTWDGGAFQLFLPQMLLNEEQFSSKDSVLVDSFDNYAAHALQVAKDRDYQLPAIFSASDRGVGRTPESHEKTYNGKMGSKELAASTNDELKQSSVSEDTVTIHGVFMAATRSPHEYGAALKKMEDLHSLSKPTVPLYCKNLGFMDGYRVKGADAHEVVSTQFSLDQGMSLMALNHMLSPDGQNASSRALAEDPAVSASLKNQYKEVDDELRNPDDRSTGKYLAPPPKIWIFPPNKLPGSGNSR